MIKAKPSEEIYQVYSTLPNAEGLVELEAFLTALQTKHMLTVDLLCHCKSTWRKNNEYWAHYIDLWGDPGKAAKEELGK